MLPPPPGGAEILVFGVIHGDPGGYGIGDAILARRPATVVVETAVNDVHGSATGAVASMDECLAATGGVDARTRAIAQIGARLSMLPDPGSTELWGEVSRSPMFYSEHLAYAATWAVGARLLHGDRPKMVTYQRMLWQPTVEALDTAFGLQSAQNYVDLAPAMRPPAGDPTAATEAILIGERDAVLLESLHKASLEAGEGAAVVGVVGASHLPGMRRLWEGEGWRKVVAAGAHDLPPRGSPEEEGTPEFGVRRALFDGVIRLTCRPDVTADIMATLGVPPPGPALEAYELAHELYGSCRMLLAVLERDQLAEVCSGWRCDLWDVLAPLRAVRPVNGGPGYDEDLVLALRSLNFEIN